VYAIGDVARPPLLAHKASHEGIKLVEHLAGQGHGWVDYGNIPSVTYCHPEVASCGLTEQAARERGLEVEVGSFPWSASGRARTAGESEGFVKVIRDRKYSEIVGAHIWDRARRIDRRVHRGPTPRDDGRGWSPRCCAALSKRSRVALAALGRAPHLGRAVREVALAAAVLAGMLGLAGATAGLRAGIEPFATRYTGSRGTPALGAGRGGRVDRRSGKKGGSCYSAGQRMAGL
jgi:hypothetical protein